MQDLNLLHKFDEWETPDEVFQVLHSEFGFTRDACAKAENAKLKRFWNVEDNGLLQSWVGERVWCNPPYSHVGDWVAKVYAERDRAEVVVMLTFAKTDTRWFHEYVYHVAELRFLRGRVKFLSPGHLAGSAPYPSMLAIYA